MRITNVCVATFLFVALFFATEIRKANLEPLPKLRGDEIIQSGPPIPYLGGRSPGDSIGITTYDYQANGGYGQRLALDDNGNIHIDWMWCAGPYPPGPRNCAWNFRFSNGSWYGETPAAPSISGYVQLDIVRDTNPDNQVTAIAFHHDAGAGYFGWVDTDAGQGWGSWPNNPVTPGATDHIWPYFCCTENGNIVIATGDYTAGDFHHLYYSTDMGANWTFITTFDSCGTLSQFLRSSHNSNKVVFIHTQFITDQPNVTLNNDVYCLLSTDGGVTWGPHSNITNYQIMDTVRAFNNVNAVFDRNDNLHIAWTGAKCYFPDFYSASKIFHWDEVNDTITIVSSPSIYYPEPGGWWISPTWSQGAWSRPADQPQLVVDPTNNDLYCLWHGNDDYNDCSAAGYFNGEFYGAKSTDGGITWTDYTNLTNTRTPGAPSGACDDEDYMTANPYVVNDSIYVTYVEDKDAGSVPHTEGVWTVNPVRCWIFHKDLIPGVEERSPLEAKHTKPMLDVYPNPFREKTDIRCMIQDTGPPYSVRRGQGYKIQDFSLKIFDAAGQLIKDFPLPTSHFSLPTSIPWQGDEPPGVYFVQLENENFSQTTKVIKIK